MTKIILWKMFFTEDYFPEKCFYGVWSVSGKYFLEKYVSKTNDNFNKLDSVFLITLKIVLRQSPKRGPMEMPEG